MDRPFAPLGGVNKESARANELSHATYAKKIILPVKAEGFREALKADFSYHLGRHQRMKLPFADSELVEAITRLWDE